VADLQRENEELRGQAGAPSSDSQPTATTTSAVSVSLLMDAHP
jgi:hypothetical protein